MPQGVHELVAALLRLDRESAQKYADLERENADLRREKAEDQREKVDLQRRLWEKELDVKRLEAVNQELRETQRCLDCERKLADDYR
jgi:hypothetical protein